jgi:hypothetical protein
MALRSWIQIDCQGRPAYELRIGFISNQGTADLSGWSSIAGGGCQEAMMDPMKQTSFASLKYAGREAQDQAHGP